MIGPSGSSLSRRERQIMDIVYRFERPTVAEVMAQLSGRPAYSTVRAQLRVLEEKGHLRHEEQNLRYVYLPTVPRRTIRRSALNYVVETFFEGSPEQVVAALLGKEQKISTEQLDRIAELIEQARKDGSRK
jgi:BlaI family transcriptional regulator, penicillinase repressor